MKRFYKLVQAVPEGEGFTVHLDGRPLRTPLKQPLRVGTKALADAVADEWEAQEDTIRPETQPLTRLAATCIDKVRPQRSAIVQTIGAYGETDLICYVAAGPEGLRARQLAAWQPWQAWASARLGAPLRLVEGIMPVAQPAESLARLRDAAAALEDERLTVTQAATPLLGSLVLALAFGQGLLDAASAFEVSLVDELYQQEQWGCPAEAAAKQDHLRRELQDLEMYLGLAI